MVLGTVEDMHTPNMGGPRFDYNGQHTDSIQMAPGGMVSADVMLYTSGESPPAWRRTAVQHKLARFVRASRHRKRVALRVLHRSGSKRLNKPYWSGVSALLKKKICSILHPRRHHPAGYNELQCRVADHVWAGMRATYYVAPNPTILDSIQLTGKLPTHNRSHQDKWCPAGHACCIDPTRRITVPVLQHTDYLAAPG